MTQYAAALPRLRGPDRAAVLAYLKRREAAHRASVISLLVFGLPLSLLGPLLINLIVYSAALRRGTRLPFWPTFWLVALISLPLLFLLAAAVKGSVMEKGFEDDGPPDSTFGYLAQRRKAQFLFIAEIMNAGPRMVVHAFRKIRGRRVAGNADFDRIAAAIVTLGSLNEEMPPEHLVIPGEPPERLEQVLTFLMYYDIADISRDGDRVWLRSDVRRKLGVER